MRDARLKTQDPRLRTRENKASQLVGQASCLSCRAGMPDPPEYDFLDNKKSGLPTSNLASCVLRLVSCVLCLVSCVLCLVSLLCIIPVTAEGAFEHVELGARPLGMGSAYVAIADGASAIFWSPAGITQVDRRELTMSYMELYGLVSYSSVGYAQRAKIGSMGLGLASSSDVDGIYRETILALSTAGQIYPGLSIGSNIKHLSSAANTGDLRIGSGNGLSLDMGCQYRVWKDRVSFGIALQNLVGYVSYNRETVKDIPGEKYSQRPDFSYKIGAGINLRRLLHHKGNAVLAAELSDGDIHIGAECIFWDVAAARAGFRAGNALTRSITAGLGLKLSAIRFDYAYVGSEVGCQTSQFSVSINW